MPRIVAPISIGTLFPARAQWDVAAGILVVGILIFLGEASRGLIQPLSAIEVHPVTLDPRQLPIYALRTTGRMLAAMAFSLVFTFTYATLAAKNRKAELILVPLLDILQSVPILGFISVTVVFFMSLAPGRAFGAELAAVFAIFTSQAWNMAFSFYQSLRTVPVELGEATRNFGLSPWMRFWKLDVPFALPSLIWNMMMSMSGGWFFVVASEAISVGHTTITLPGIGSYIALAIERRDLHAVGWAIGAMLAVILLYDQLLFRPLVNWAERFRIDQEPGVVSTQSFVLKMLTRSALLRVLFAPISRFWRWTFRISLNRHRKNMQNKDAGMSWVWFDWLWSVLVASALLFAFWHVGNFILHAVSLREIINVVTLGLMTLARVMILIFFASLIWVPVGVLIGMRPKFARAIQPIAQFMAAFPANILFPMAVSAIVALNLNPDIWLSPLMILGTQWYILFNVIAGASAIPKELSDISLNLHVRGWLWWRKIALPAVMPYYLTGAITASGGSWNASIVAETASWGDKTVTARGLGSYIAHATAVGDYHRIVLGIAVMCLFVILVNRAFWRPLYGYAERKYRMG